MNIFIVIFDSPIAEQVAAENAAQQLGEVHPISTHVFLIRSYIDDPIGLSRPLLLMDDQEKIREGVVFKLNGSHSGYFDATLWRWLEETREMKRGQQV